MGWKDIITHQETVYSRVDSSHWKLLCAMLALASTKSWHNPTNIELSEFLNISRNEARRLRRELPRRTTVIPPGF